MEKSSKQMPLYGGTIEKPLQNYLQLLPSELYKELLKFETSQEALWFWLLQHKETIGFCSATKIGTVYGISYGIIDKINNRHIRAFGDKILVYQYDSSRLLQTLAGHGDDIYNLWPDAEIHTRIHSASFGGGYGIIKTWDLVDEQMENEMRNYITTYDKDLFLKITCEYHLTNKYLKLYKNTTFFNAYKQLPKAMKKVIQSAVIFPSFIKRLDFWKSLELKS